MNGWDHLSQEILVSTPRRSLDGGELVSSVGLVCDPVGVPVEQPVRSHVVSMLVRLPWVHILCPVVYGLSYWLSTVGS